MPSGTKEPIIPIKEFDAEMATTRKMLENLPTDKDNFKPHEKSMEFGRLVRLVSIIPSWMVAALREESFDLSAGAHYATMKASDILTTFDKNVAEVRTALQQVTGEALDEKWSLKAGEKVLMTMSRGEATRQDLNHLIHHRGQLAAYERMLDMKLPQIYGPSADVPWQG
ncbi:MAG: DinB family protein [Gemmatimonadaceae bacterium]